jgi:LuxR family maltose regulon positive regulatory protein
VEFLRLLASGYANADIAKMLVISLNTVKTHVKHIYGKLGARNRTQAIASTRTLHSL